jgi:protein-glutamine gamma-glutamyltransferase
MIQISGIPFQQSGIWPSGSIESVIIQRMQKDPILYSYKSIDELRFELKLRKNIIQSARAMNQSKVRFTIFATSRCNPHYWNLTYTGGFQLRYGIKPSDAIRDIYKNSSLYAFECATAKVIIYYHAILNSIGEALFNQFFQNLYLYSWHFDPDLGLESKYTVNTDHFIPGDVIYFDNPDFDTRTYWWRGENAVDLGDGTYFGHGLGIRTAENMIQTLNKYRKPGSHISAYLMNLVARPSFSHLADLSLLSRGYPVNKIPHVVIHHNESSISIDRYLFYLIKMYNQMNSINPFP